MLRSELALADARHMSVAAAIARALELVEPDFVRWSERVCMSAAVVRAPSAEAISVVPAPDGTVVTVLAHFRHSYWPLTGSDWGEHELRVYELTVASDGTIRAERLVLQRGGYIHEVNESDYDDARVARSLAGDLVAERPQVDAVAAPRAPAASTTPSAKGSDPDFDRQLQRALDDATCRESLSGSSAPVADGQVWSRRSGSIRCRGRRSFPTPST